MHRVSRFYWISLPKLQHLLSISFPQLLMDPVFSNLLRSSVSSALWTTPSNSHGCRNKSGVHLTVSQHQDSTTSSFKSRGSAPNCEKCSKSIIFNQRIPSWSSDAYSLLQSRAHAPLWQGRNCALSATRTTAYPHSDTGGVISGPRWLSILGSQTSWHCCYCTFSCKICYQPVVF